MIYKYIVVYINICVCIYIYMYTYLYMYIYNFVLLVPRTPQGGTSRRVPPEGTSREVSSGGHLPRGVGHPGVFLGGAPGGNCGSCKPLQCLYFRFQIQKGKMVMVCPLDIGAIDDDACSSDFPLYTPTLPAPTLLIMYCGKASKRW